MIKCPGKCDNGVITTFVHFQNRDVQHFCPTCKGLGKVEKGTKIIKLADCHDIYLTPTNRNTDESV